MNQQKEPKTNSEADWQESKFRSCVIFIFFVSAYLYFEVQGEMFGSASFLFAIMIFVSLYGMAKYKKNTGTEKLKKYDYTSYEDDVPYYTMIIQEDGRKIKLLLDLTEEMLHTMKTQFPERVYFA